MAKSLGFIETTALTSSAVVVTVVIFYLFFKQLCTHLYQNISKYEFLILFAKQDNQVG